MTKQAKILTDAQRLENLTNALVDDILRAPDEDVLLEELGNRFDKLREERDFLKAQLAGERKNIAGWIAARDAQVERAKHLEAALRVARTKLSAGNMDNKPAWHKEAVCNEVWHIANDALADLEPTP